jgi:TonB family protein
MTLSGRHFYSFIAFSAILHFVALTMVVITPAISDNEVFTELKIKLGTGKPDLGIGARSLSENSYFKQQVQGEQHPATETPAISNNVVADATAQESEPVQPQTTPEQAAQEVVKNEPEKSDAIQEKQEPAFNEKQMDMLRALAPAAAPIPVLQVPKNPPPKAASRILEEGEGEEFGNSTDSDAKDLSSYEQMLPLWLDKFRVYPEEAIQNDMEGRGDVFVKIDRTGRILLSKIIKSTGHPELDMALTKMLEDADPVIPVPADYYRDKKTFSYKITFEFVR